MFIKEFKVTLDDDVLIERVAVKGTNLDNCLDKLFDHVDHVFNLSDDARERVNIMEIGSLN